MRSIGFYIVLSFVVFSGNILFSTNNNAISDFFSPNSTLAHRYFPEFSTEETTLSAEDNLSFVGQDSAITRILMFEYSAFDLNYVSKVQSYLQNNLTLTQVKSFSNGTSAELEAALIDRQLVVLPYASKGESGSLQAYGAVLKAFVKKGGAVILTGTHEYEVLRQLGLFDLDYGYYYTDANFKKNKTEHPLLAGIPVQYSLESYAYPLDVSDAEFTSVIDVNGYCCAGYKLSGKGVIIYLGMEYYADETFATRMLANAANWGKQFSKTRTNLMGERTSKPKRATLRLAPNDIPANETINLRVYPNPFWETADIDLAIAQSTPISVEMTDQTGQKVWSVLPRKTLAAGRHILELPTVPPGVYFIKCKSGEVTTIKKVVKMAN
jgi:Secretion system C-terminal sorting domain